ncbi:MAG: hypothetical protein AAGI66_06365 [Cyanobacteria bacterium P01_H01_bin.74]
MKYFEYAVHEEQMALGFEMFGPKGYHFEENACQNRVALLALDKSGRKKQKQSRKQLEDLLRCFLLKKNASSPLAACNKKFLFKNYAQQYNYYYNNSNYHFQLSVSQSLTNKVDG